MRVPFPMMFFVDNAASLEKIIKSVFSEARVLQDVKHLVNRLIEKMSKNSDAYYAISQELHGAFTGEYTLFFFF
jgi:hypothetical protein